MNDIYFALSALIPAATKEQTTPTTCSPDNLKIDQYA